MYTYQDLQSIGQGDADKINFVYSLIREHKGTTLYNTAQIASEYMQQRNRTIVQFQKLLYKITGEAVPDNYSANYKLCSNFFSRFVTQENQYLLGNGVTWGEDSTASKLGDDFDNRLQEIGKAALWGGVAFGFFNMDHLVVFDVLEFAPLYDEENGALMAGVRFWQVSPEKPMRATLYELDGYTDYLWKDGTGEVLRPKRAYILNTKTTPADGTEIYDGENYPTFPIVPLWGNSSKLSAIVGLRENIDAYDLIKSGFANTIDDASEIYWTLQNAGGMDDIDLATFIERMKTVKAAVVDDDGAKAEAHTLSIPTDAREAILNRLRNDMYDDAMALDTKIISSGATTATQIKAAYEPLNSKADDFEYQVSDFLRGILTVAGIEDKPSFTRSMIVNTQEEIQTVIGAGTYLDQEYVVRKVLTLLGDGDQADDMIDKLNADAMRRQTQGADDETEEDDSDDAGNNDNNDEGEE